jgi:hypothetical protein
MLFGTLEILICLGTAMLVIFTIGVGLLAQNIALERKDIDSLRADAWQDQIACPHCQKALNPEAIICRFCRKELNEFTLTEK